MKYFVLFITACFGHLFGYQVTVSTMTPITNFEALKHEIIVRPETIVTTTHELSHQAKTITNVSMFQEWIARNEQQCPIALLTECTSSGCRLSRLDNNNHKRNRFDELAAERLATTQTATGAVNYVSFAAGGGFTDLHILTLAHSKGLKNVIIHLIDMNYASCITKLKSAHTHDIASVLAVSPYRAHSIKEFFNYVTHLFGAENVEVHIYGSGQEYLNTVKLMGAFSPDLIIGVDFDPSKKTYKTCMQDFIKIIEHGSSQALHLHGNGIFHIAPKATSLKSPLPLDRQKNRYNKNLIAHALLF